MQIGQIDELDLVFLIDIAMFTLKFPLIFFYYNSASIVGGVEAAQFPEKEGRHDWGFHVIARSFASRLFVKTPP
jgi:hypothetical protein